MEKTLRSDGKPKRDQTIDLLKAYACLLVVFGHVIMGVRKANVVTPAFSQHLESFIWTFHVPLFMFLSGYVYRITGAWRGKGSRALFILHKLLNLGVPYFVFSSVYIAINSLTPGVNTAGKLTDILWLWRDTTAQYWFLYALFLLFVFYTVLSVFLKDWQITAALFCVSLSGRIFGVSFGSFSSALDMALAFGLGVSVKSLLIDAWSAPKKLALIAFHIAAVGACVVMKWDGLPLVGSLIQILGIAASIALISLLARNRLVVRALTFINRYSFPIFLLHTIFTAAVRIVLSRLGVGSYAVHVLAGMCAGITPPILVAWLFEKAPILDFLFYPSRGLRKMKSARGAVSS